MVKGFEPEKRDSYFTVAQNPTIKGPLQAFVGELANEGVLSMFIDFDKIIGLNLLLEAKGIKIERAVTRENYIGIFVATILGHVMNNTEKEPGTEVTVKEIKEILDDYIDNARWSRFFEIFWHYSYIISEEVYKPCVQAYKKADGTNQSEKQMIDQLFRDAFPAEKGLTIPGKKWDEEHIRDLFNLSLYLKEEYIDEVFGSIQRINETVIKPNMRETIDICAIACVEIELFVLAQKELNMTDENVDEEALRNWLETMKVERRLCIMTLYYLFAHKNFAMLVSKK